MHRDEWTADAEIKTDDGKRWLLKYYVRVVTRGVNASVYGIKIEKYAGAGMGALCESEATPALTASYTEAAALALRFAENTVTPSVLLEMADDYVSYAYNSQRAYRPQGRIKPPAVCRNPISPQETRPGRRCFSKTRRSILSAT